MFFGTAYFSNLARGLIETKCNRVVYSISKKCSLLPFRLSNPDPRIINYCYKYQFVLLKGQNWPSRWHKSFSPRDAAQADNIWELNESFSYQLDQKISMKGAMVCYLSKQHALLFVRSFPFCKAELKYDQHKQFTLKLQKKHKAGWARGELMEYGWERKHVSSAVMSGESGAHITALAVLWDTPQITGPYAWDQARQMHRSLPPASQRTDRAVFPGAYFKRSAEISCSQTLPNVVREASQRVCGNTAPRWWLNLCKNAH